MGPLVLGIACLAIGWLFGARWRAGRPAQHRVISPSDAGRALSAARQAERRRRDDMTRQLRLEIERSGR